MLEIEERAIGIALEAGRRGLVFPTKAQTLWAFVKWGEEGIVGEEEQIRVARLYADDDPSFAAFREEKAEEGLLGVPYIADPATAGILLDMFLRAGGSFPLFAQHFEIMKRTHGVSLGEAVLPLLQGILAGGVEVTSDPIGRLASDPDGQPAMGGALEVVFVNRSGTAIAAGYSAGSLIAHIQHPGAVLGFVSAADFTKDGSEVLLQRVPDVQDEDYREWLAAGLSGDRRAWSDVEDPATAGVLLDFALSSGVECTAIAAFCRKRRCGFGEAVASMMKIVKSR
jgi:hypothetical protein